MRKDKSFIAGGLTGSLGILITKMIGIVYISPFTALATQPNMVYYAYAYQIYANLLNFANSGIPAAIAILVAAAAARDRMQETRIIRSVGRQLMFWLGFLLMLLLFTTASGVAQFLLTDQAATQDLERTRNVLMIISVALLVVPMVGAERGYLQGLKEFKAYSFSQVLEQLVRVGFLLGAGFIAVVLFRVDPMWTVYFAVLSTSVSALASYIYLRWVELRKPELNTSGSDISAHPDRSMIFKNMVRLAIPFVVITLLAEYDSIINLLSYSRVLLKHGVDAEIVKLTYSIWTVMGDKILSIPQVVSLGFGMAAIPFLTEHLQRRDFKKIHRDIRDHLDTVLYLSVPIVYFIFVYAPLVYTFFYGYENYQLGGYVMRFEMIYGQLWIMILALTPVLSTLNLRRTVVRTYLATIMMKVMLVFTLTTIWPSYEAYFMTSIITVLFQSIVYFILLKRKLHMRLMNNGRTLAGVLLTLGMISIPLFILHTLGVDMYYSRATSFVQLLLLGVVFVLLYAVMTWWLGIPQRIFGLKKKEHSI